MEKLLTQLNELEIAILEKMNIQELVNIHKEICYSYYTISKKEIDEYNILKEESSRIFDKLDSMNIDDNDDLWVTAFNPIEIKRKEIKKKYNRFWKKYNKVLDDIDSILFDKTNGEWGETVYG